MRNHPEKKFVPGINGILDPLANIEVKSRQPNLIHWLEELDAAIIEGIVLLDDSLKIVYFSSKAELITGWKPEEVCGRYIHEVFISSEPNSPTMKPLTPSKKVMPMVISHHDGQPISVDYFITQLPFHFVAPNSFLLLFRDRTIDDTSKKLRSSFLANITHEFRTPLSSLNASVEFLLDEIHNLSREEIGSLLTSVSLSVTGLQTLIDNLLESIRIEAGRFSISPRPVDLVEIINEAKRLMSPLLIRRQQCLKIYYPGQLPKVRCDPSKLTQVLVNLLSNASKYGPTQQAIEILVETLEESRMVRVSVVDRGPGIPKQERQKIFRQFYRIENKANAQDGIGLGLWVVRMVIEEHGGKVGVEEHAAQGTVFWFTIPNCVEDQ